MIPCQAHEKCVVMICFGQMIFTNLLLITHISFPYLCVCLGSLPDPGSDGNAGGA